MDSRTISLVRTTFKAVAAVEGGPEKLTRSFYAILFARNPEARDLFPASMSLQRDKLLTAIAYAIDQLENLDRLLPFLQQLGRDHRKYGIVDAHYAAVGDALITALEQFAGTEMWTEEVEGAWREVIGVMATTMIDGANGDDGSKAAGKRKRKPFSTSSKTNKRRGGGGAAAGLNPFTMAAGAKKAAGKK